MYHEVGSEGRVDLDLSGKPHLFFLFIDTIAIMTYLATIQGMYEVSGEKSRELGDV
jgi:hypothetical protein